MEALLLLSLATVLLSRRKRQNESNYAPPRAIDPVPPVHVHTLPQQPVQNAQEALADQEFAPAPNNPFQQSNFNISGL